MSEERGHLFVVSAPSGAGKSTLIHTVMERLDGLAFSVSWTTRRPRPGETDGVEYHFADTAAFEAKIAAGEMLEWARVHGQLYGTGRAETEALLDDGWDVILDIDVQGAGQVRQTAPEAIFVFVLPPDRTTLEGRLTGRGTESDESLAARLGEAAQEIRHAAHFDYVVINDDLERATGELEAVFRAARARRARRQIDIDRILGTFDAGPQGDVP